MHKAKLLGSTVADGMNGILRNTTIAVPWKYLSNFSKSLEISLINWKVESKLKWMKDCVLSAAGAEMLMLILMALFLLSKTQNYKSLYSNYQQKTIKNYQNFLVKNWKIGVLKMNTEQKVRVNIPQSAYIFSLIKLSRS